LVEYLRKLYRLDTVNLLNQMIHAGMHNIKKRLWLEAYPKNKDHQRNHGGEFT
jgi:hypothetical protein